jgi:hypothetical protein
MGDAAFATIPAGDFYIEFPRANKAVTPVLRPTRGTGRLSQGGATMMSGSIKAVTIKLPNSDDRELLSG